LEEIRENRLAGQTGSQFVAVFSSLIGRLNALGTGESGRQFVKAVAEALS